MSVFVFLKIFFYIFFFFFFVNYFVEIKTKKKKTLKVVAIYHKAYNFFFYFFYTFPVVLTVTTDYFKKKKTFIPMSVFVFLLFCYYLLKVLAKLYWIKQAQKTSSPISSILAKMKPNLIFCSNVNEKKQSNKLVEIYRLAIPCKTFLRQLLISKFFCPNRSTKKTKYNSAKLFLFMQKNT